MNAERLLAHFKTISEAPDAVARLRRFILDLAVRGKLVEQDPEDEPAEELFCRYLERRMDLASQAKIRRPKPSSPIRDDETPIALPCGWTWARLNEIGNLSGGMTPSMGRPDFWNGEITWLSPKDIKSDEVFESELRLSELGLSESRLELYPPSCLFIVARSGILKRTLPVAINRVSAAANQDMKVLVPYVGDQERYLQIMLKGLTDFILKSLVKAGTTVQSLKYGEFAEQPFPIPPLAEQHRIVAKVDELMALCDQLEAARQQREQHRERLVAASLQRLNQPFEDPASFRTDASFALQVLPSITTTPAQIKQLRQTILNLAVRGKLVEQDPEDEPAEELFGRILELKIRSSGKLPKSDPQMIDRLFTNEPFAIPDSWTWVVLGQITDVVTSGSRDWAKHYSESGAIFVRMGNLAKGDYRLRLDSIQYVSPPAGGEGTRTRLEAWDVLVSITGDVGMLGLIPEGFGEAYINQHTALARPCSMLKGRYLPEFLRSDFAQSQFQEPQRGIKNSFRLSDLSAIAIPLPPLAEQHRIVAKVDELMALCDQLEQQLSQADQQRRRLLEALLAEALGGRLPTAQEESHAAVA